MNFLVHDSRRGKVFATLREARAYANAYQIATGEFVAITETCRNVTHTYNV